MLIPFHRIFCLLFSTVFFTQGLVALGQSCVRPQVRFIADTACLGKPTRFTDRSLGLNPNARYEWDINADGIVDYTTTGTVRHSYPAHGTYRAKLRIFNTPDCVDSAQITVVVLVTPVLRVLPESPTLCEPGRTIDLVASGAVTYNWAPAFGLSSSTGAAVTAAPPTSTAYTLTGTSGTCTATAVVAVTVRNLPPLDVAQSTISFCRGGSPVLLTATGGESYTWAPATGLSATTGAQVQANPTTTTNYTLTAVNGSCIRTRLVTIPVVNPPQAVITPSVVNSCAGRPITLTGRGGDTYAWAPPDPTVANPQAAVITPSPTVNTVYTLTVAAGSCTATATASVTVLPTPDVTITGTARQICPGRQSILTATSSFNGATYSWAPLTGLSSGSGRTVTATPGSTTIYTVTVTASGCTNTATYKLDVNDGFRFESSIKHATLCRGDSIKGTIQGEPNAQYSWSPSTAVMTSGNHFNLKPSRSTIYTITGTSDGCRGTATVAITVVDSLIIRANPANFDICITKGKTVTLSGAQKYEWLPMTGISAVNDSVFSVNPGRSTTFTVTGLSGQCTNTTTVVVRVDPLPEVTLSPSPPTCADRTDGMVTAAARGGTPPYRYALNGTAPQTSGQFKNVGEGTASVTVLDAKDCEVSASVTLQAAFRPVLSIAPPVHITCHGRRDGSLTVNVTGAPPPYIFVWSTDPPQRTAMVSGLSAGTYTVTVTTTGGCSLTAAATVTEPPVLTIPELAVTPPNCVTNRGGVVRAVVTGGTEPYTYRWNVRDSTGAIAQTPKLNNVGQGTYLVTVTDARGCTTTNSTVLSCNCEKPIVGFRADIVCLGNITTLTPGVEQAAPDVTYQWDVDNDGRIDYTSKTAIRHRYPINGTYFAKLVVTNPPNCVDSAIIVVTVNARPNVLVEPAAPVICEGESGIIQARGAETYLWRPAAGLSATTGNQVTANPLVSTTYTIEGTNTGCPTSETVITVQVKPKPQFRVSAAKNPRCEDDEPTELVASGANVNTYVWEPTTGLRSGNTGAVVSANPSRTTTYTVTLEENGCIATRTLVLNVQPVVKPNIALSALSFCSGSTQRITLTATGGSTYVWAPATGLNTNSGAIVTALPERTTTYTVTATLGVCTGSATATVTVNPTPNLNVTAARETICSTGAGTAIFAAGATTYRWSPTNGLNPATGAQVTARPATTTTYTVTGITGPCSMTRTVRINVAEQLTLQTTVTPSVICAGEEASVQVSGAETYRWNPSTGLSLTNPGFAKLRPAVTTTLTITGTQGDCSSTVTATVVVQPRLTLSVAPANPQFCLGATPSSIVVTGADSYEWRPAFGLNNNNSGRVLASPAQTTTYTITGYRGVCSAETTVTVLVQPAPVITTQLTHVSCAGTRTGTVVVNPTGGTPPYLYGLDLNPSGSSNTFTQLAAGSYTVNVRDGRGCEISQRITITAPPALTLRTSSLMHVSCANIPNGSVTVAASGGTAPYAYVWENQTTLPTRTGLAARTYTVTVTDANRCTTTLAVTITQPSALAISTSINPVSCEGRTDGTIFVNVTGGVRPYRYTWTAGLSGDTPTNVPLGQYQLTVTEANGCTVTASVTMTMPPALTANFTNIRNPGCGSTVNGSIMVNPAGGTGPYRLRWFNQSTLATLNNLTAGRYTVTVTDARSCTTVATYHLQQEASLQVEVDTVRAPLCVGQRNGVIRLRTGGGREPITYRWSSGNVGNVPAATNLPAGSYTITITDATDCIRTIALTLTAPRTLTVAVTVTQPTCFGLRNGLAIANPSGGREPYFYAWSVGTGTNTKRLENVPFGNHQVTVTDANGCSVNANVIMPQPDSIRIRITPRRPSCLEGASDGLLQANVTGGIAPYRYRWSFGGVESQLLSNITSGIYTITVIDNNNCSKTSSYTLLPPDTLQINPTIIPVSCTGGRDGSIQLSPSGGTSPYNIRWSTGSTALTISNLSIGSYSVTLTDALGCSRVFENLTINDPANYQSTIRFQTVSSANQTAPGCFQLTPASPNRSGAIWNIDKINLQAGFDFTFQLNFGQQDLSGGDGIAFVLQNLDARQSGTQGLGYASIEPSVAIELDTYFNGEAFDIPCDHIAVHLNGNPANPLGRPVQASADNCNIEDGRNHAVRIVWEPTGQRLRVFFDGVLRIEQPIDLINRVFNGVSLVYWGFTASTSSLANTQTMCVDRLQITCPCPVFKPSVLVERPRRCDNEPRPILAAPSGYRAYRWTTGDSSQTLLVDFTGQYAVMVTDAEGCTGTSDSVFVIISPSIKQLTFTPSHLSCFEKNDGKISVEISGGTPPFVFNWQLNNAPFTTAVPPLSNLSAGEYAVTISDLYGCSRVGTTTVTTPTALNNTGSVTRQESCAGARDGEITVVATGGTPPYYHQLTGSGSPQTNAIFTGLSAGEYTVLTTDANGCQTTSMPVLVVAQPIPEPPILLDKKRCTRGIDTLTAILPDPQVTVRWYRSRNALQPLFTGQPFITPPLTQTQTFFASTIKRGCESPRVPVTVFVHTRFDSLSTPNPMGYTWLFAGGLLRFGGANPIVQPGLSTFNPLVRPSVIADLTGELVLYSDGNRVFNRNHRLVFSRSTPADTAPRSSLFLPFPGKNNAYIRFTTTPQDDVGLRYDVFEVSDTVLQIGTGYTPNAGVFGDEVDAITAVRHSNGVDYWVLVQQKRSNQWVAIPVSKTGVGHFGVSSISGQPLSSTKGLITASTDGRKIARADVPANRVEVFDFNPTTGRTENPVLFEEVPAIGGLAFAPDNSALIVTSGTSVLQLPLKLQNRAPIPIGTLQSPGGALQSAPDGQVYIAPRTGRVLGQVNFTTTTYSLRFIELPSNANLNGTLPNISPSFSHTQDLLLQTQETSLCPGKTTRLTALPGFGFYRWERFGVPLPEAGSVLEANQPGEYRVQLVDTETGCAKVSSVMTIMDSPAMNLSFSGITPTCGNTPDGQIYLTVLGGIPPFTFRWQKGNDIFIVPTITQATGGTYHITVTDAGGCTKTGFYILNEPTTLTVSLRAKTPVSCQGLSDGMLSVVARGGTGLLLATWNTGERGFGINHLSAGFYTVTVSDRDQCTTTATYQITEPQVLSVRPRYVIHEWCQGNNQGEIALITNCGTPGYIYRWHDGSTEPNRTNLTAGTYTVTVIDANGCKTSFRQVIESPPQLKAQAVVKQPLRAGLNNGIIEVEVSGGAAPYKVALGDREFNNQFIFNNLGPGEYSFKIQDEKGCQTTATAYLTQPTCSLKVSVWATPALCPGHTGTLTSVTEGGIPPIIRVWSNDSTGPNQIGVAAGRYTVTVTDNQGCTTFSSAVVRDSAMVLVPSRVRASTCHGRSDGSAGVSVQGGLPPFVYTWSDGQTTDFIDNVGASDYEVTVADARRCVRRLRVTVPQGGITISPSQLIHPGCDNNNDGSITVAVTSGLPPYLFTWSNGQTTQTLTAVPAGNYQLTVTDATRCIASASFELRRAQPLTLTKTVTEKMTLASVQATATGGIPPYQFWLNEQSSPTGLFEQVRPGRYWLTVLDSNGCRQKDSVTILADLLACVRPTLLMPIVVSSNEVRMQWLPVLVAQGYEVNLRPIGQSLWQILLTRDTAFVVNNLLPNTDYQYRVRSVCGNGIETAFTEVFTFRTPASDCRFPGGLIARAGNNRSISANWIANPLATRYLVTYTNTATGLTQTLETTTNLALISNLSPGRYRVTVQSRCQNIVSGFSQPVFVTVF